MIKIFRYPYTFFLVLALAIFSLLLSLQLGSLSIPLYPVLFSGHSQWDLVFYHIRLPRTLTAFTSGGLLALAGALMQLLLQNPLADPYVLGVSSGAALMTLACILLGATTWLLPGAWLGSLLIILLIFSLSRKHHWQAHTLLLIGVALAGGFSAGISFLLLMTPHANLHSMLFWLTGDLNTPGYPWLGLTILGLALVICWFLAPGLDILGRGEKEALALGLPSRAYRIGLYLLSSLCTATAVTLAGCLGFIGLIVPHSARLLTGYAHRRMLPVAALLGGSLVTLADTGARLLFAPQQIPVGIVIAFIGVPVFIWLLQK